MFSCSDSDNGGEYNANGVKVVAAQTSIEAAGGTATVEVNKPVVKAYAADEWLKVSVDANSNKVVATTESNSSRESRSTTLVVKASDTDSTIVNVSQKGLVFSYSDGNVSVDVEGGTVTKEVKANEPLTIVKCPEWATAEVDGSNIKVTVAKAEDVDMRSGYVVFGAHDYVDSIKVSQVSFDKAVLGKYYYFAAQLQFDSQGSISGYNLVTLAASLTRWQDKLYMEFPNYQFKWLVNYDKDNLTVKFDDGQYVGMYNRNRYYAYQFLSSSGNMYLNSGGYGSYPLQVENNTNLLYAPMSGDIYGEEPAFDFFVASSTKPATTNSLQAYIFAMAYPFIVKNDGTVQGKNNAQQLAISYYTAIGLYSPSGAPASISRLNGRLPNLKSLSLAK